MKKSHLEEQRNLILKLKELKEGHLVQLESLKQKIYWDWKIKQNILDLPKQRYKTQKILSWTTNT